MSLDSFPVLADCYACLLPSLAAAPPPQVWYSAARDDHFVTATNCAECEDLYVFLGTTGWIYNTYQAGTVPLFTDFNGKDNMLSASTKPLPGYSRVRQEGWAPGTANANTTLLLQYYNSVTGHHWAVDDAWVTNATAAGFGAVDILANVLSSGPPIASAYDFYVGTFQRLTALYGDTLSWYWSWTPEGWEWDNVRAAVRFASILYSERSCYAEFCNSPILIRPESLARR